jgi:hypothetical protein
MPRDFVPCVYSDRILHGPEEGDTIRRLQVIECFAGTHLASRDRLFHMSLDSHAVHLDTVPEDDRACAHLFTMFYAAMAALE